VTLDDAVRDIEMTYEMLFTALRLHGAEIDNDAAWGAARDMVREALITLDVDGGRRELDPPRNERRQREDRSCALVHAVPAQDGETIRARNRKAPDMYSYAELKPQLFTDDGQRLFLGIRDQVHRLLKQAGAVRMQEAMQLPGGIGAADSWTMIACVDRLVELGELREIKQDGCVGQHRVFVSDRQ
jgi:hypothetical protein